MARTKKNDESRELFEKQAKVVEESVVEEFVEDSYLPYAWSICLDRALVNVQDGLKPIQRRILYTAHKKGLTDKSSKMKSVIFEGDVLRYSPHGGAYGSIVNMSKSEGSDVPKPTRVPLIRGKGNWGGVDGGGAAACFIGETEIHMSDGSLMKIEDICDKVSSGEELFVYCCDKDGNQYSRRVVDGQYMGEKEIIEVVLDNGESIFCTKDHRFMLKDGTYKEAQFLTEEDDLMEFTN